MIGARRDPLNRERAVRIGHGLSIAIDLFTSQPIRYKRHDSVWNVFSARIRDYALNNSSIAAHENSEFCFATDSKRLSQNVVRTFGCGCDVCIRRQVPEPHWICPFRNTVDHESSVRLAMAAICGIRRHHRSTQKRHVDIRQRQRLLVLLFQNNPPGQTLVRSHFEVPLKIHSPNFDCGMA